MFTGIVTDVGEVVAVERGRDTRFVIATRYDPATIDVGASISHAGVCLTATDIVPGRYAVVASPETLARTTLSDWSVGARMNLERSLRLGDELGGHLVFGHVDDVGTVVDRSPDGDSVRLTIEIPAALCRYVAVKGSLAVDGVSLTVNELADQRVGMTIIPHTQTATTLGALKPGDRVNLEVDMLARYVERMLTP